jgi:prepilin-type N-terminal cleavage/methylation domain-containing protein
MHLRTSVFDRQAGFSLIELLVALLIASIVAGAALAVAAAHVGMARTQPMAIDLQQRARVGIDLLYRDLYMAGAGMAYGPQPGPLRRVFAPIVPRRMGLQSADAPTIARADAITLMFVPGTRAQSALRQPLGAGSSDLFIEHGPQCPAADLLCALAAGASVVVFDDAGHFDFFTVTSTAGDVAHVRPWQPNHSSYAYPAGAAVSEAESHTYYFDAKNRQLRHFDGYLTDIPVVDEVVGVAFDYEGDPLPPQAPKPPLGTANCLYDTLGMPVPGLMTLPAHSGSLATLPLSILSDGPWCGDGDDIFDADLLRIRRVNVTLRLQVGNDMMRGRSTDFAVVGRGANAAQLVPDYAVRFEVAPRNMGWDR